MESSPPSVWVSPIYASGKHDRWICSQSVEGFEKQEKGWCIVAINALICATADLTHGCLTCGTGTTQEAVEDGISGEERGAWPQSRPCSFFGSAPAIAGTDLRNPMRSSSYNFITDSDIGLPGIKNSLPMERQPKLRWIWCRPISVANPLQFRIAL